MLTILLCSCSIAEEWKQPEKTACNSEIEVSGFHPLREIGYPTFMSLHMSPIVVNGAYVCVVNTPADTVDVIDTDTRTVVKRINVDIDPVSIAECHSLNIP